MKQVVQRILVWSFKARKKPKTIYILDEGIKKTWLPSIKNIEFKLISVEEVEQKEKRVYFFTMLEQSKNVFNFQFCFKFHRALVSQTRM